MSGPTLQRALIGHGGSAQLRYGDITDYATVQDLVEGCSYIVHATAYFPSGADPNDDLPWLVNVKGLWNILDCARKSDTVKRVVHIGSPSNPEILRRPWILVQGLYRSTYHTSLL
jgi:nucleoside-diphosphate-sugar epimerase